MPRMELLVRLTTSRLDCGLIVPTPTLPAPSMVILTVGALLPVPEEPAVAVAKSICEDAEPVEIPPHKCKKPPDLSVAPEVAPPAWSVSPEPAELATEFFSMPILAE